MEWALSIHYLGPSGGVHYGCTCPKCNRWLRLQDSSEPLAVLIARRRGELRDLEYLAGWADSEDALRVVGAC